MIQPTFATVSHHVSAAFATRPVSLHPVQDDLFHDSGRDWVSKRSSTPTRPGAIGSG